MKGEEDMYEELQAIKNELRRVQESEEALVRVKLILSLLDGISLVGKATNLRREEEI